MGEHLFEWRTDPELPGYECCDLPVADPPLEVEAQAGVKELRATLIRRGPSTHQRAALYVHGWNDYFFQAHVGEYFASQGFDFYAIDLRRYGRNLRPGMLGGYITDLTEYFEDLDAALKVILADHDRITLVGHSTGGLTAALFADARPGLLNGVVLNSPWIDGHGSRVFRALTSSVLAPLGNLKPTTALPAPDSGFYARTVAAERDGEWTYNHKWKTSSQFSLWIGWLRAITQGQARVASGLHIDTPVEVLISTRSDFRRIWNFEIMSTTDIVLDVANLAEAAVRLGPLVTLVRIEGGQHDLSLSREPARQQFFDEITRWMTCYVR